MQTFDPSFFLIVIGVAEWLGVMAIAIALPLPLDVVKITKWLVNPRDAKMKMETYVYSYHRPSESAIGIHCCYAGMRMNPFRVESPNQKVWETIPFEMGMFEKPFAVVWRESK